MIYYKNALQMIYYEKTFYFNLLLYLITTNKKKM